MQLILQKLISNEWRVLISQTCVKAMKFCTNALRKKAISLICRIDWKNNVKLEKQKRKVYCFKRTTKILKRKVLPTSLSKSLLHPWATCLRKSPRCAGADANDTIHINKLVKIDPSDSLMLALQKMTGVYAYMFNNPIQKIRKITPVCYSKTKIYPDSS